MCIAYLNAVYFTNAKCYPNQYVLCMKFAAHTDIILKIAVPDPMPWPTPAIKENCLTTIKEEHQHQIIHE